MYNKQIEIYNNLLYEATLNLSTALNFVLILNYNGWLLNSKY